MGWWPRCPRIRSRRSVRKRSPDGSRGKGFTLCELVVAVALLGMLGTHRLASTAGTGNAGRAGEDTTRADDRATQLDSVTISGRFKIEQAGSDLRRVTLTVAPLGRARQSSAEGITVRLVIRHRT